MIGMTSPASHREVAIYPLPESIIRSSIEATELMFGRFSWGKLKALRGTQLKQWKAGLEV